MVNCANCQINARTQVKECDEPCSGKWCFSSIKYANQTGQPNHITWVLSSHPCDLLSLSICSINTIVYAHDCVDRNDCVQLIVIPNHLVHLHASTSFFEQRVQSVKLIARADTVWMKESTIVRFRRLTTREMAEVHHLTTPAVHNDNDGLLSWQNDSEASNECLFLISPSHVNFKFGAAWYLLYRKLHCEVSQGCKSDGLIGPGPEKLPVLCWGQRKNVTQGLEVICCNDSPMCNEKVPSEWWSPPSGKHLTATAIDHDIPR